MDKKKWFLTGAVALLVVAVAVSVPVYRALTPLSAQQEPVTAEDAAPTAHEMEMLGLTFEAAPDIRATVTREDAIETVLARHFQLPGLLEGKAARRLYTAKGAELGFATSAGKGLDRVPAWLVTIVGIPPVGIGGPAALKTEPDYSVLITVLDATSGDYLTGITLTYDKGQVRE